MAVAWVGGQPALLPLKTWQQAKADPRLHVAVWTLARLQRAHWYRASGHAGISVSPALWAPLPPPHNGVCLSCTALAMPCSLSWRQPGAGEHPVPRRGAPGCDPCPVPRHSPVGPLWHGSDTCWLQLGMAEQHFAPATGTFALPAAPCTPPPWRVSTQQGLGGWELPWAGVGQVCSLASGRSESSWGLSPLPLTPALCSHVPIAWDSVPHGWGSAMQGARLGLGRISGDAKL